MILTVWQPAVLFTLILLLHVVQLFFAHIIIPRALALGVVPHRVLPPQLHAVLLVAARRLPREPPDQSEEGRG